jgi:threonine synthase
MDISRASNFERFVYDLVGGDGGRVKALWRELGETGQFDLSAMQASFTSDYGFVAGASSHADRLATIRSTYDDSGVLIDPHTADGVKVARAYLEPGVPMLVLETALPAKFSDTIQEALGRPVPPPAGLADLESLPQRVQVMDCDADAVKAYVKAHAVL